MATVKTADLIAKFQHALNDHWGYILNTAGEKWTQAKQNATKIETAQLYGQKWVGHYVSDCSTAVFVLKNGNDRSHVGLYIGDDKVIEAASTQQGVIQSSITNKKWAEWGELKGVDYSDASVPTPSLTPAPAPTPIVSSAVVNDTKVALRSAPSTKATVLTRVNKGERVQVLDDKTWTKVSYQGKTGYMMTKFLNT